MGHTFARRASEGTSITLSSGFGPINGRKWKRSEFTLPLDDRVELLRRELIIARTNQPARAWPSSIKNCDAEDWCKPRGVRLREPLGSAADKI